MLYALLPIIRNTFTGISGVDPAIREAGRAMGMTDAQLLWKVEIPLALGVIFAGIRVATVIAVGSRQLRQPWTTPFEPLIRRFVTRFSN